MGRGSKRLLFGIARKIEKSGDPLFEFLWYRWSGLRWDKWLACRSSRVSTNWGLSGSLASRGEVEGILSPRFWH